MNTQRKLPIYEMFVIILKTLVQKSYLGSIQEGRQN